MISKAGRPIILATRDDGFPHSDGVLKVFLLHCATPNLMPNLAVLLRMALYLAAHAETRCLQRQS